MGAQWWSMRRTQRRQTRQWWARGGLCRPHFWQKRASPLCARTTLFRYRGKSWASSSMSASHCAGPGFRHPTPGRSAPPRSVPEQHLIVIVGFGGISVHALGHSIITGNLSHDYLCQQVDAPALASATHTSDENARPRSVPGHILHMPGHS